MEYPAGINKHFALVFPGQGCQYVGMGRQLYEQSAVARSCFAAAEQTLGVSLHTLCFDGPADQLDETVNAQPAILTLCVASLAVARTLCWPDEAGPMLVAGHSMGQLSAIVAAGALDFSEALLLVRERGRLMEECGMHSPGGMAAVIGLDETVLARICTEAGAFGRLTMANDNSPGHIVISGEQAALERAMQAAEAEGARMVRRLAVSIPAHSPLMLPAAERFREVMEATRLYAPAMPVISNVSGTPLTDAEELRRELYEHLAAPVQWTRSVRTAAALGARTFVEIGPRAVLAPLVRRIERNVQSFTLTDTSLAERLTAGS